MFKISLFTLCLLMASSSVFSQKLTNGKNVSVRLTSEIYSNTKEKVPETAIVDKDVKDASGSYVLIRIGPPVTLDAMIQKARGVGKPASVQIKCLYTTAVDGQEIALQGGMTQTGKSKKGTALGVGLGVGIPVCWPVMFCLCIKGEKITIPENTIINNVVVNDDYAIRTE